MNAATETAALTLSSLGVLFAIIHLAASGVLVLRHEVEEKKPEFIPWGYMGVGMVLAFVAFFAARGIQSGTWGAVQDASGLVMVFTVASAGFGAAHEWITLRMGKAVPWTLPLGLSVLMGTTVGLAGLS